MRRKLVDKNAMNKLYIERMGKLEQETIKLKDKNAKVKEESKKLTVKLKQTATELEEIIDGAVDLVELNLLVIDELYKNGPEIQEFLNTY